MDTTKIIIGTVGGGRYTVTAPIVKEDYGLYLKIEGLELPSTYEVDFSNSEHNGTSVTMIGNADGVLIPSQFISSGKDVFAFLYHVDVDFGRTVYKFRIPNKLRPDRTNEEPTPEEQSVIDQAISALNSAVAQTAQDKADADVSAQNASADADRAEEARTDAQNYATQAEQSATDAHTSASQASASATASAQSAEQSAINSADAQDSAEEAQASASASAQSATASANSASQASASATSASQSASSAQGYASSAQTSAQTASAKASEASTSASTASTKASESAQSASQALTYKNDAEQAKTASQTAQGLAESARDSAISAKEDAEDARDEAQSIVDGISGKVEQIDSNTERIESLEDDRYKPYPTDTASGAIASFPDGADDIPLKSLIVDINPIQDLHGQENPYPAGGGKNVFPPPTSISPAGTTTIANDKGVLTISSTGAGQSGIHIPEFTFAESGQKIELLNSFTYATIRFCYQGEQVDYFSLTYANRVIPEAYITALQGKTIDEYRIQLNGATSGTLAVMVTPSSDSALSAFSPYENICPISGWTQVDVNHSDADMTNPTTITIDLGQTVYGGKLDVLTGELVIDRAMVDLGTLNWTIHGGVNGRFTASLSLTAKPTGSYNIAADCICDRYVSITQNQLYSNYVGIATQSLAGMTVFVYDSAYDSPADFKAAMNGAQFCYELRTPITIQLTPNQVNSLLGVNNIWADSGDTEVEYRADTKLFIERLTAPDSSDMVADANITSGQYFMVGNSLYKATANIANGGQITVGTNCTRVSLAQALNEINA